MPIFDSLLAPLASILNKVIPDKATREKAQLQLLQLHGTQDLALIEARLSAIVAEAQSSDAWTRV